MAILIGIDTGVHTGFAVWHSDTKYLAEVSTMTITQAIERVKMIAYIRGKDNIRLFIEDARQRKWFGNAGREKLQGAGSVKRDSRIWEDWCREQGFQYRMVAPKNNRTKLTASQFKLLTKWTGATSEHARDSALLVFGR
ncbi:hypothetical protein [Alistipes sp.]|uniref:hypothetical protein n=1 Tax=Alistipes sp. TaxID=1872444 RepID=UPI003AB7D6DF